MSGEADLMLKVAAPDLASFHRLITALLLQNAAVATIRSSLVLTQHKATTAFPVNFAP